jgi:tRNA pseudouridine38-40 synthase
MPRYRLLIEYDGAAFAGWQRVGEGLPSVQAALEEACRRMDAGVTEVVGAGRTDAGVHALGQVAHVDMAREIEGWRLADALNAHLRPTPVAVLAVDPVSDQFHARFSALGRKYLYRIVNRRADLALERGRAWRVAARIDVGRMAEAADVLIGHHDFTTFRDMQCQAQSPVKTLDRLDVSSAAEEIHVWAEARSFLHRQVRSMVGTIAECGAGRFTVADVRAMLAAKDRSRCGTVAPAEGLYLAAVTYPDQRTDQ